jgi:NAD(P)-dependent dehydrogenase (short-subunit alcohol dehydrogenase family)
MSPNSNTKVYFITGANRGIGEYLLLIFSLCYSSTARLSFVVVGLGLVEVLLSKHATSNIAIFATARNPAKSDALIALQNKYPKELFLVAYNAEDKESANKAAKEVESRFGWVDIVVANAGEFAPRVYSE